MLKALSIIIVNYNVKELLLNCIQSIYKNFYEGLEIIVIDNNSSDGSVPAVKSHFPDVILIENNFNAGFSGANNQGIAIAKGENVLLLNPDTEVKDDALNKLIFALKDENVGIVAPKLLNSDGSLQPSSWRFPKLMDIILETFFLHAFFSTTILKKEKFNKDFYGESLSGAALMFRRGWVEEIGVLDPSLFWMEDVDLCFRNYQTGKKNLYLSLAEVIHHSGKSSIKNLPVAISNQLLSKIKFFRKHHGSFYFFISSIFIFIHLISRILIFSIGSFFKPVFKYKLAAYLFTFKKFYRYLFLKDNSVT